MSDRFSSWARSRSGVGAAALMRFVVIGVQAW
jgi:hypothetical protein